jgi:metal-responsive CopG/Arc/MetJ family transcriptional regulator
MKVKTSVTLSEKLLAAIDEVAGPGCNRSAVLEEAAAEWVRRRRREERDRIDADIYARLASDPELQKETQETLELQAPWWDLGDDIELSDEVLARIAAEETTRAAG